MKVALFALTFLIAATAARADEDDILLADGAGHDITAASCAICHSLDYIPMNAPVMNRATWEKTVQKMITRFGAPIDEAAAREILDYLATHYHEQSITNRRLCSGPSAGPPPGEGLRCAAQTGDWRSQSLTNTVRAWLKRPAPVESAGRARSSVG